MLLSVGPVTQHSQERLWMRALEGLGATPRMPPAQCDKWMMDLVVQIPSGVDLISAPIIPW